MKDHHLNIFIEFAKFSFNKHLYSSSQSIFHKNFIQNVHEYLPTISYHDMYIQSAAVYEKAKEEKEKRRYVRENLRY